MTMLAIAFLAGAVLTLAALVVYGTRCGAEGEP
jgi:hypothetical protein